MDIEKEIIRTPAAESFTQLILETFRFNGLLLAAGDRLTKELNLTSALWQVLGAIDKESLPLAQIARNMGLTRQSVRRTAGILKNKGFVEFQQNPNHQRAKLVVLTKKGRNVLDRLTKLQIDWANRISKGLGDNELKAAIQTIKTVGDRL